MAKHYVRLTLGMIDEGLFIGQADVDLSVLQQRLLEHVAEYGEQAEKAKAKLTIELTLSVESVKDSLFAVVAKSKMAVPARPASTSLAISDVTEDGEASLFVRRSGSSADTPRQGKLCTADGRTIDQETGRPLAQTPARSAGVGT